MEVLAVTVNAPRRSLPAPRTLTTALVFVGAHAALGIAASSSGAVSKAHFVIVAALVLWFAWARRPLDQVAALAVYAGASEVFWRMTGGAVFWEGAKYIVAVGLGWTVLRLRPLHAPAKFAALYFVLLLPAVVRTILFFGTWDLRDQVSFYLAGPLVIAAAVAFFSSVRTDPGAVRVVQWAAIGPIVAISAIALRETVLHGSNILFTDNANAITSGNYGPNQVSAVLSFGALVLVILALHERHTRLIVVQLSLAVLFGAQSALTFSRGGVGNLAVAVGVGLLLSISQILTIRTLVAAAVIAIVVVFGVLPRLELFTSGELSARFTNSSATGRDQILDGDLRLFRDSPILGVGVGVSPGLRTPDEAGGDAAHTEYSRLLAEHGILGAVALVILFIILSRAVIGAAPGVDRFAATALAVWAIAEMGHSALRVAVTGLAVGLAWMFVNNRPTLTVADEC